MTSIFVTEKITADGNPLHEARFNQPAGLAYDPDTDMFYIGDIDNKGIRYMTTE